MLAIVNILPIGKGASLRREVALALDLIDRSGLDYRLTAMGTVIEGDWDPVMRLVKRLRDRLLKRAGRVYLTLAIDDRKERGRRLESKTQAVESVLGRRLRR